MSVTASDVVDKVRYRIGDIGPQYKYLDLELLSYIDEAQKMIVRMRPESTISGSSISPVYTPTTIDSLTDTLQVQDNFISAVVEYCCYKAFVRNQPGGNANASQMTYNQFISEVSR